jgi:hypothetical protein
MAEVTALPARGDVFLDERGTSRALRLSWHHDGDVVVLSLWRGPICAGTFRMPREDVPALIASLTAGLAATGGSAGRRTVIAS